MKPTLLRRLGTFDLALLTVGIVIGSGIFRTPATVAQRAHLPGLILACWIAGGAISLAGAFIYAELAARRPVAGGQYGYLRDAYHPIVAFLLGWTWMLIAATGANAAAAVLFAGYLEPLTGLTWNPRVVSVLTLACLAGINLLGVRQGGSWQNLTVVLKVGALVAIVVATLTAHVPAASHVPLAPFHDPATLVGALGVAMLPILFTYNGFANATFVSEETIQPQRTIPRGLILGIGVIIVTYVLANAGYLNALGAAELAISKTPAADAMTHVAGSWGGRFIALAIALSTLGYLSAGMLAHPRIYHQMAVDGTFFKIVSRVSPGTRVPFVAIVLHATIASIIALSGTYEQIVNWVVAPQWLFPLFAAGAIFIFRRRDAGLPRPAVTVPGHPVTTILFAGVVLAILANEAAIYPRDTLYGIAVLVSGAIAFVVWQRFAPTAQRQPTP